MKKIYLLLALTVGLVTSCDMDTMPAGTIPEEEALMTPDDFRAMRNGLYSGLRSSVGGTAFYTASDVQSDEFHALVGNSNTFGDMYRWDFTPQNSYVSTVYGNYQAVIARANFIIQGYNSCDFSDASTFDEEGMAIARAAKGDSFFARAYCLFMLSQYFCADYEASTADEPNSGVSYRLDYAPSSDPSTYPARKTLNETYAQIEEDLDSAALYITTAGAISSDRITVDAITALRARAALAKDDYTNASSYASSLVDGGNYILASSASDLTDLWSNDGGMETILQLAIGDPNQFVSGNTIYYQPVDRNPDFVPTQTLLDLYSANDYRRSVYFNTLDITTTTGTSGTVFGFNKIPLETRLYNGTTDSRGVIEPKVFRIAEMYLIAAEAYAQLANGNDNNLTRAAYYLNELERNRIRDYQDQTFASRDAIMQEIMDERTREMLGEGTRMFDIKRWHIVMERGEAQNESLCLTPGSTTTSLTRPADSDRMTWPIPQNEIDLTDRIVQNPGY